MNWELAFQSTWNATIVFAGALAVGLLCYVFYRRKKERIPPRVFKLLVLLRSLAVLVIALFLLKPVIRYSRTEKENTIALVLLDISESMGIKDAAEGKTRLKAAMDALGEDKLLEKLQEKQKVHTYTFGSFVTEIENPDQFVKKSGLPESEEAHKATAIGEAIKETVSRIGESAISGLILLSDGINTKGADPQDVARFLGVPVYTLLAGGKMVEQGEFVDLGIASVPRDLEFIVDNKATIQIRVSNHGLGRFTEAERKLPLELKQKGENLASKHILFPASDGMREVEISYTPEKTGLYELELSFPVLEGETIEKNNKRTFTVRIIDPKIPTLLVEGTVRQEYKFLRHVLESDPNVEFTSVIKLRKDRFFHQGVDPGIKLNMGLPVHKKDYEKFDVIILGDISRREFSETQLEYLQEFVGDGGGLCVMGGYHAFGAGSS
ncbi:MAG: hypothetical protein KGZ25_13600, partial [Planctomycetes bacterium]|nr:hypothetical protein [Planctomycetota bacterium]